MRGTVVEEAMVLWMSRAVDFAYWADVPLAVDTNMAKIVAFETSFRILRVILMEWSIYWYSMYSPGSLDLLV